MRADKAGAAGNKNRMHCGKLYIGTKISILGDYIKKSWGASVNIWFVKITAQPNEAWKGDKSIMKYYCCVCDILDTITYFYAPNHGSA